MRLEALTATVWLRLAGSGENELNQDLTSPTWSGHLATSSEIKAESWSFLNIAVRITLKPVFQMSLLPGFPLI